MSLQAKVREFHEKFGFGRSVLEGPHPRVNQFLQEFATGLLHEANSAGEYYKFTKDPRFYRLHLMMEELGEICEAMSQSNEVLLADGIADLLYVTLGTAETFNIPAEAVFDEVHRSNMSKTRDDNDSRMRCKDPARGYFPPDVAKVLREHK